jgi:hypothetical protein
MENRFRFSRARTSFDCFDCMNQITIQAQFCFDNLRNVRICEPCFLRLSNIVGPASPPRQAQTPIIPPKEESCSQCQTENRKRTLKEEFDTAQAWLEDILSSQDMKEAEEKWKLCDSIAWDREERQTLGFAYVKHLAQLKSLKLWGKKMDMRRIVRAVEFTPNSQYVAPPF